MAKQSKSPAASTSALHAQTSDGNTHLVAIGNLRVVLVEEDGAWFAQGLEIDYAAQGNSVEAVKRNFEQGLAATVDQHIRVYGTIENLLAAAPPEVWKDVLHAKCRKKSYSQFTLHEDVTQQKLPFEGIDYIELEKAA
jgi:hypothetical protein